MAQGSAAVMPPASPGGRRRAVTVLVVVLAAALGAVAAVAVWRAGRGDPAPPPSTSTSAAPVPPGQVSACTGGPDPATAVVAAVKTPATPEGAAETAAAVVRFTESKAFGEPAAVETIKQIADRLGSPELLSLQEGQAQHIARMTATAAHPGRGAFAVSPDPVAPTVTVLTPVQWSTAQAQHHDWRFIDVRLTRDGERWTAVSADSTPQVADELKPLRGADVKGGEVDQYGAALTASGFRRYAGDC